MILDVSVSLFIRVYLFCYELEPSLFLCSSLTVKAAVAHCACPIWGGRGGVLALPPSGNFRITIDSRSATFPPGKVKSSRGLGQNIVPVF